MDLKFPTDLSGSKVGHAFVLSKISSLFAYCMQWSWAAPEGIAAL
jgi:hypothetical protein